MSTASVPPPWTLNGDVYFFAFWTSKAEARALPSHTFSPLEGKTGVTAAGSSHSRPVGGVSMIQIIRYHSSPVGPYDELIVCPGSFEWTHEDEQGRRTKKRNPRISRIYVSQKETCRDGRLNWNVPKHLARFDWTTLPNGSASVSVFPHDTTADASEATPSTVPFFQTTFAPLRFSPSFPLNMTWSHAVGVDTMLVLPPLPAGVADELPGTGDRWCAVVPQQQSRRSMLGWFDVRQNGPDGGTVGEFENFWPGLGRWRMGIKMENAEIVFAEPEVWQTPKSNL